MTELLILFAETVLCTLGVIVLCGLAVALCEFLFLRLMGRGVGGKIVKVTSIVGTPVHELGHALMCLLFGHKITDMKLWDVHATDGTLGYVTHSYNPKNPYKQLGNLFIGVGPVFSGLAVITLLLWLCFPDTLGEHLALSGDMIASGDGILAVLGESLNMIPRMFEEMSNGDVHVAWRILGIVGMLSISLHINLSPADIKGALRAIPWYLALAFVFSVIVFFCGSDATAAVSGGLYTFAAYLVSLFSIVLVFSLVQVVIATAFWLIRLPFSRR